MSTNAAYAVYTKSRAKYGKRLTDQNYRDLLSLNSVSDVASYLKSETHYAPVLKDIQESAIHRNNLEKLLRLKTFEDLADLCHFEESVGEHFFEYIILRGEINELLQFIRYYNAGHPENYLFQLPVYFNHHTPIDLVQLSKVKNFDGILEVFAQSPLQKIIANFRPKNDRIIDYPLLEAMLQKYLYAHTLDILQKHQNKKVRKELRELFLIQAELENLRKIYRSKKFFHISKEFLTIQLLPYWFYFNKKQVRQMIEAEDYDVIEEIIKNSYYQKLLHSEPVRFIDEYSGRILYKICRKYMRFSPHPAVVMASCIILFELEIEDITNIIEGVRYNIPAEEISKLMLAHPK